MHSAVFSQFDPMSQPSIDGGPLFGKRAAVQCSISVKGWPTEAGSRALRGFVSLEDATVVERLRLAGATLVGNTHTGELGFGVLGDGAARAITDGHADLALMTDTMGEARVAAASAGLLGFKPSYGRVSRFGLVGMVPSMDCCSILGKNLDDMDAVFKAIEGWDERDPSMGDRSFPPFHWDRGKGNSTISAGIVPQWLEALDTDERGFLTEALGKLEEAGIGLREVQREELALFRATHNVIGSVEASSSCGKFDGVRYGHRASGSRNWNEMYLQSRGESFGPLLKAYLFQGAYFQFENYAAFEQACRIRARLLNETTDLRDRVDLLILPTRRAAIDTTRPRAVEPVYEAFSFTLPANITGQPALSLPGFVPIRDGDLGLQMVGPLFGDELLFEVARRLCPSTKEIR